MLNQVFSTKSFLQFAIFSFGFSLVLVTGCAVSAKNSEAAPTDKTSVQIKKAEENSPTVTKNSVPKGRILIATGSPADAVRVFYKNLRERKFREAMLMTNLRVAVEGLSDAEMQDLSADFEPLAKQVPAELEINGEIITNNLATVTAKLPNDETGSIELKQIPLRLEKDTWVMLIAEAAAEELAKKEGKNYFFTLRMDIHHAEAENMMQRIAKGQLVYSMQNNGLYADMPTLISLNLLPNDIQGTESTGYRFTISVKANGKKYFATAEPAVYGKSGKLSFLLESEGADQKTQLKSEDNKGKPMKK